MFFKKIFLILFIFSSTHIFAGEYELLDRIKVIVEKDVVTEMEIEKELHKKFNKIQLNNFSPKQLESEKKEILDRLIEKKIIIQFALQNEINISEEEIEIVIKNILDNNNIKLEQLEKELIESNSNLNEFKDDLRFQLTVKKIKDREIMPYVNISDYEILAWLNNIENEEKAEYKVLHILIKNENPNKKQILSNILNSLKIEDFSKLAKEYSEGPFAQEGGNLGWNKLNELPEIFQKFVENGREGEISDPIKSSNGYHLLKIESIRDNSKKELVLIRQYKFQQIILKVNAIVSDEDQKKKLEVIKNRINDGLKFSSAIQQYSEEQFNIDEKKLEWISISNLLPEFRNQLDNFPKQNLIGPFKTQLGWHLLKVFDVREADFTNETKKQQAKIKIAAKKTELRFKDWLNALKQNSKIKYIEND